MAFAEYRNMLLRITWPSYNPSVMLPQLQGELKTDPLTLQSVDGATPPNKPERIGVRVASYSLTGT